jgi:hypothetical protein
MNAKSIIAIQANKEGLQKTSSAIMKHPCSQSGGGKAMKNDQ